MALFKKLFGGKSGGGSGEDPPETPADPVEAAKAAYEALKLEKGATDPDTLQALFAFGQALNGTRRFEEAEGAGQELLAIFETEYGKDHPNVGYGLDIIATALSGQEKRNEALSYRKRGLDLLQAHFGAEHEMTLQRARLLAVDHVELGQVDKAQGVLDAYMPAAKAYPPLQADFMDTKAFVTQAADGPEAAIPILEDLIAFFREHDQAETPKFASKLFNLSQLYLQAGRKEDALNASSEAGMVALQTYGPDHPAAQDIFGFQTELREAKERGEF